MTISTPESPSVSRSVTPRKQRVRGNFFVIMAAMFVALAVIGLVTTYTPVPYWDMWDGYVLFYTRLADGDWQQWFARHNEHRLLLSRVLFWMDISWFGGRKIFLLACNLLFFGMLVGMMTRIARGLRLRADLSRKLYMALIGSVVILGFSWIQNVNFTWAFQSQFLTAYLLPLCAFYSVYLAATGSGKRWFIVSVVLGVLAAGTMANGVLTLFVLFALSLMLGVGRLVSTLILLLAVATVALYFSGGESSAGGGGLLSSVVSAPLAFIAYLLSFLGNPFYYMLFRIDYIEIPFGIAFVVLTLWFFYRTLTDPALRPHRPLLFVLFAFIAYVAITAALIASGRTGFGLDTANTSRYTTPTLYAWIALMLIAFRVGGGWLSNETLSIRILIAVSILLLPDQLKTLKYDRERLDDQMQAALALELKVNDPETIRHTFPGEVYLLNAAERAREMNISVFGDPAIKDAASRLQPIPQRAGERAHPSMLTALSGGDYRIEGWVCVAVDKASRLQPLLLIARSRGVGYALTRSGSLPTEAHCAGDGQEAVVFAGYLKHQQASDVTADTPLNALPLE